MHIKNCHQTGVHLPTLSNFWLVHYGLGVHKIARVVPAMSV